MKNPENMTCDAPMPLYDEHGEFSPAKIYLNLYVRNISSNILGFMAILILLFFTPFTLFQFREFYFISEEGWLFLLFIFPLILIIIALLQYYFQCPVCAFIEARKKGFQCDRYSAEHIRRRVLNLPLILAIVNLSVYLIAPVIIIIAAWSFDLFGMDIRSARLLFLRTVMIGLLTACLSFFIVESYCRRVLVPMVFPTGGLTEVKGAIKINVLRRIRLFFLAGTLTPMFILVFTIGFVARDVVENPGIPNQPTVDIFLFAMVLSIIFTIIGFRLNVLVGRSIVTPLESMLKVVKKVKKGDFTQQIRIVSNDEIGVLAEAGNNMIKGLAERERVRESFGRYLTPEIRDKILSGEIPLDGERKIATMLFSDLRDFSSYVEENSPEEVILGMREYFTAMEEAIRQNNGLVIQYVGDEIEAVFGVPLETKNHADKAIHAALEMKHRLSDLNRKRQAAGKTPFRNGIGICSGIVLAGNTGSKNHPSYGLIGETVNKASRIQGLTKDLNCGILVCTDTLDMAHSEYTLQEKGSHYIKGHINPVTVYEVI